MTKIKHLLAVLLIIGASGALMGGACEDAVENLENACGPCGEVAYGDSTISGDARLDGLFKALGTVSVRTGSIRANFDANVIALGEAFGVAAPTGAVNAAFVGQVKTAINTEITAKASGGVKFAYQPPKCSANVDVSLKAQAQCEAKVDASCSAEVKCDPGKLSFECSGKCEGSCSAECTVPSCKVKMDPGKLECSGSCTGSCAVTLEAAASCEGKCEGECSGECSAYDGEGNCSGSCSGECTGKCEVSGEASVDCKGECRGSCEVESPSAEVECEGELGCKGECSGECSGSCSGEVKAPKCEGKASCNADVSAKCEASASAQASAELSCTPPTLSLDYAWNAGVDAAAQAEFIAKMEIFKGKMTAILQGFGEIKGLFEGSAEMEAPVVTIGNQLKGIGEAALTGDFDVSVGLIPCTLSAFKEVPKLVTDITADAQVVLEGGVSLLAVIQ